MQRSKVRASTLLLALSFVVMCAFASPVQAQGRGGGAPQQQEPIKIVFLAGPKDHGAVGRHEYEKNARVMAWVLENATNLETLPITTEVLVGPAPRDLSVLEDADLIVLESSGDWQANETHVIFQQAADHDGIRYDAETTAYLQALDRLIRENGIGVAIFHYTMWVENRAARTLLDNWVGGNWIPYLSQNPVDTWSVSILAPQHQILRGVDTWTMREEMYSRYFLPYNPGRTELLLGTPANNRNGPQTIAFALERQGGGRGFVYGGVDFHDTLHQHESLRRFLANALIWTAGRQVPQGGVQAPPPPQF
jgi:type 1 glutamine amidotransferase